MSRVLLCFRGKDLRLDDHLGVERATASDEIIPLFVLDPFFFDPQRAAAMPHRMQMLLDGQRSLAKALEGRGSRLIIAAGRSVDRIPELARAWRVDEGIASSARQLLATGFVPNRARMVSASFLTKQLMIDYRRGEARRRYLQQVKQHRARP